MKKLLIALSALLFAFPAMAQTANKLTPNDNDTDSYVSLTAINNSGFISQTNWITCTNDSVSYCNLNPNILLGGSSLQSMIDGKANVTHTHVATDISDSTSVGRSVLTASTQAAARTAISAGTSNFSGSYNDLTGAPSVPVTFDDLANGTTNKAYTNTEKTKLAGISAGATANDTDANLKNRANHTGTQTASTISDFTSTARAAISVTGNGSYNSSTGVVTVNNPTSRTFNYPTRSLNSCFQISSTQDALVSYSVDISTTLSLTTGQTGTVYLRTYSDSGCSTGTQEITRFVNGNTGTLTLGLNLTQNATGTLSGAVAAGKYVKMITENTVGSPTFTYRSAQEVLQ